MRIVHYLPIIRPSEGGVPRSVLDFCAMQSGHGIGATLLAGRILTLDGQGDDPAPGAGGAAVHLLGAPRRLGRLLDRRQLRAALELLAESDLLHLHSPWLPSNAQLASAARRVGVPYVVTIHGMLDGWSMAQQRLKKRVYLALRGRRFLQRADSIHFTARAEQEQARRWIDAPAPVVLPLLVDLSPFERLPGPAAARAAFPRLARGGPTLLFLSRVHPKKGAGALIEAIALIQKRGIDCQALIAGPGEPAYVDRLRLLAQRLGVGDRIAFLGLVSGMEKVSLFQSADLFVLPTRQENFGLALIESLACQTPIVTTAGVDIWQELRDAGASIVDAAPAALAEAIARLLLDPARRDALGDAGRRWVFESLAPGVVAPRYEAWYASVIDARRRRAAAEGAYSGLQV